MVSLRALCAVVIVFTRSVGISLAQNSISHTSNNYCDKNVVSVAFKDLNIQKELSECTRKADLTYTLSNELDISKVEAGATPKEISKFCSQASCRTVIKAIIMGPKFDRTDCINSDGYNFNVQLLKLNKACELFMTNRSTSSPSISSSPAPTSAPTGSPAAPNTSVPPTSVSPLQPQTSPTLVTQSTSVSQTLRPNTAQPNAPSNAPTASPNDPIGGQTTGTSNTTISAPTSAPNSALQRVIGSPSLRSPTQTPSTFSFSPSSPTQYPQSSTPSTPVYTESQQPVPKPNSVYSKRPSTEAPLTPQYC
jgi:hypothetical protein